MIIKQDEWNRYVELNKDPYGKCCVDVAREVMRLLDEPSPFNSLNPCDFDPHKIICDADNNIKAGGITGFMAGCVAQMIVRVHSRGGEFKEKWNKQYDDKPREGVINPAIIIIKEKESEV